MPPFPPPRLSCDRSTWIGYDYEKRKLRLHFDAEKGFWRCGRGMRLFSCTRCHQQTVGYLRALVCGDCYSALRTEFMDRDWARAQRAAHSAVGHAIRHGRLAGIFPETACVDCGAPAKVYDHRDYLRPLDVEPVCTSCNLRRPPAVAGAAVREDFRAWLGARLQSPTDTMAHRPASARQRPTASAVGDVPR